MTTIAWDGKTLAVDSAIENNETIVSLKGEKLFNNIGNYRAVAIAGSIPDMMSFISWLNKGGDNPPEYNGGAFAVDKKGKLFGFYNGSGIPIKEDSPAVMGSGGGVALGAMDAGATAIEAIKIAIKRDCYTGGRVQSFTLKAKENDAI